MGDIRNGRRGIPAWAVVWLASVALALAVPVQVLAQASPADSVWEIVKDSSDRALLEAYIAAYPQSPNIAAARARLATLPGNPTATTAPPTAGSPPPAKSATLQVMEAAGLLGTWAVSCSDAASRANVHITFYALPNGLVRRRIWPGGQEPHYDGAVDGAERLTPTTWRVKVRNDDPSWGAVNVRTYDTVIELADGKQRTLTSIRDDGQHLIRDAKYGDGAPAHYYVRCLR